MRNRMASVTSVLLITLATAGVAHAQAALDDDDNSKPTPSASSAASTGDETKVGFTVGIRNVWVPKSMIELFVEKVSGGSSEPGYRFELFRRKGDFEVQLGLEYESIFVNPGIWLEKDHPPSDGGAADVRFDNFGWFTIEATFLNHTPINKYVAIRYGGGAGIGIIKGAVRRTSVYCNSDDPAQATEANCSSNANGSRGSPYDDQPYNIPPVFPVINAIVGVQVKPTDNIVINVEGGIRTLPFFGVDVGAMF